MKNRRWEKMFLKILLLLLLTVATTGYAEAPCIEPLIKPEEFEKWEIVDFLFNSFKGMSFTARSKDPRSSIRAVLFAMGEYIEMDIDGRIISKKFGVFRFCYLEDGKVRDFHRGSCTVCGCFYKSDTSSWSDNELNWVKRHLLKAQNGKDITAQLK